MTMLAQNPAVNLEWLVLVVIFIILLIVITKTLKQTTIFSNRIACVLGVCVSLLAVLGMHQQFGSTGTVGNITENGDKVEPNCFIFILIPYTAMALAILLMLLLLAIARLIKAKTNIRRHQHMHNEIRHQTDKQQERLSKPGNAGIAPLIKEERFRNE